MFGGVSVNWGPKDLAQAITNEVIAHESSFRKVSGKIRYGLEMMIILLYQVFIVLLLGSLFDLFFLTLLCLLSLSMFRMFSGGAHFSKFHHCLIASVMLIFTISFTSKYLSPMLDIIYWQIIAYPIVIFFVWRYAPILFKKEAAFSNSQKQKNKWTSILIALFLMIISLFIPKAYAIVIMQVLVYQTFTITPIGVFIIHSIDKILIKKEIDLNEKVSL